MSKLTQIRLLRMAVLLYLVLALINHLLPPKASSATQLLFDYELGLIRRGLLGELLGLFVGVTVSRTEVFIAAAGVTLAGLLGFYLFMMKYLSQQVSSLLILILALNSFAFASFVGNTGYLDAVLLVLTLLALSVDGRGHVGLGLRIVVCSVGVLIHENMLPYFSVLLGFDLWLVRGRNHKALVVAGMPVLAGALTLLALARFANLSAQQAAEFISYIDARADFAFRVSSAEVVGRTVADNFAIMAELRETKRFWGWVMFDRVPLFLMRVWPLWLTQRLMGRAGSILARVLLAGAIFAPLSLNVIAFDAVRFGVVSVLTGFVIVALLVRHVEGASERLRKTLNWPHFLIVLILNVNIFTVQINVGSGHTAQFPWVMLTQMQWLNP